MKTENISFKAISIFIVLFIITLSYLTANEIHSTKEGGNWADAKTWVDGLIPGPEDNAIIEGKVIVEDKFFCDTVRVKIEGHLLIEKTGDLNCHILIKDEKDGKEGRIENNNII